MNSVEHRLDQLERVRQTPTTIGVGGLDGVPGNVEAFTWRGLGVLGMELTLAAAEGPGTGLATIPPTLAAGADVSVGLGVVLTPAGVIEVAPGSTVGPGKIAVSAVWRVV